MDRVGFEPTTSNSMIPTIQVTPAIYQELFKLSRLDKNLGLVIRRLLFHYYKTKLSKQQSLLVFVCRSAYKAPLL
jgi:hypothetical protein